MYDFLMAIAAQVLSAPSLHAVCVFVCYVLTA